MITEALRLIIQALLMIMKPSRQTLNDKVKTQALAKISRTLHMAPELPALVAVERKQINPVWPWRSPQHRRCSLPLQLRRRHRDLLLQSHRGHRLKSVEQCSRLIGTDYVSTS
jgi:hypothetical protein